MNRFKSVHVRIEELLAEDPDEVVKCVLEQPFWLPSIEPMTSYARLGDDNNGIIEVFFGKDGDGHVEVSSEPDPEEFSMSHRFRAYFGGGESLRTRTALHILAKAIQLDNEERSQKHRLARRAESLRQKVRS